MSCVYFRYVPPTVRVAVLWLESLEFQSNLVGGHRKGLYLTIFLRRPGFVILISLCLDLQVHEVSR